MATKKCPYCAEEIQEEAVKCKHCGRSIGVSTRMRPVEPLSKTFYLPSIVGGGVIGCALTASGLATIDEDAGPLALLLGMAFALYSIAILCILLAKLWGAVQGASVRATPGKAVGFLFIPFFNFYWMFQAIWGWTVDFNRMAEQRKLAVARMPEGLALAVCILNLVGVIPIAGIAAALVNMVLHAILWSKAIDGVNALVEPLPAVDPATRARRRRWAIRAGLALVLVVAAVTIGAWIAAAYRIRAFKAEAQSSAERMGPHIAQSIIGLDRSTARPPRELFEQMRQLLGSDRFTYVILYLPDPASEDVLWRYQAEDWSVSYEEGIGFRRVAVETDFENAAVRALRGDSTLLDLFNREASESWQSVVASDGAPLAVLRLTIPGRGGEERKIH